MKVRELIEILKDFDPEAPVICDRHSDMQDMEEPEECLVILSPRNIGEGLQAYDRYYPKQWPDGEPKGLMKVCHFNGN